MASMIPRFLVGMFAGALASFFPRLVAVLGGNPNDNVELFSSTYLMVGAIVAVAVGVVVLIIDSDPKRNLRDVFTTALGVPTLLMGATLPAMARWVKTTPEGVSWLGFFYGGNIAGAVIGSLSAGFYLLRVHDMAFATFAAVALNVLVAAIALVIARSAPYEVAVEDQAGADQSKGRQRST